MTLADGLQHIIDAADPDDAEDVAIRALTVTALRRGGFVHARPAPDRTSRLPRPLRSAACHRAVALTSARCLPIAPPAPSPATSAAGTIAAATGQPMLERLQDGLGARHFEGAGALDVKRRDDAIVDDHGVALGALAE